MKQWLAVEAKQYDSFAIYTGANQREFLLDLVWWRNSKPSQAILGCESEWGNTRYSQLSAALVGEDFDKLLSFKAPYKVMIFDSYSLPEVRAAVPT